MVNENNRVAGDRVIESFSLKDSFVFSVHIFGM